MFVSTPRGCPSLASGYSRQSGNTVRTNTDPGSRPSSKQQRREREGTSVDSDGVHEAGVGCTGGWESEHVVARC